MISSGRFALVALPHCGIITHDYRARVPRLCERRDFVSAAFWAPVWSGLILELSHWSAKQTKGKEKKKQTKQNKRTKENKRQYITIEEVIVAAAEVAAQKITMEAILAAMGNHDDDKVIRFHCNETNRNER